MARPRRPGGRGDDERGQVPHLDAALDMLRDRLASSGASSAAGRGRLFEQMVLAALRAHPGEYGPARFKQVWAYNDWPGRSGADIGIDIVAEQTESWGGGLAAIQCKLRGGPVPIGEIDKFLAASVGEKWKARILVTTGGYSRASTRKLAESGTEVVTRFELDDWPTDWRKIALDPDAPAEFSDQRHVLRPDQENAVQAAAEGLAGGGRGRLLMPCGTGKSLVGLRIAERLAGAGKRVLYLVPSISLMDQTMRMWAQQRDPAVPHRYLGVCSDDHVGASSEDMPVAGLPIPVTTDSARITDHMTGASGSEMAVCFSTYQSLDRISEAQRSGCPGFDIAICDEAHRTAGGADKLFARIHDAAAVQADRRLYMTATQRIYRSAKAGQDIISMEDEGTFGPILYSMSFGEAIDHELLTDYKVLAVLVREGAYGDWLHSLEGASTEGLEVDLGEPGKPKPKVMAWQEVARLLGCWDALADPASGVGGPVRKVGEPAPERPDGQPGHCRRAIAFTTTISASRQAARTLEDLAKAAIGRRGGNPPGVPLATDHVDGAMNAHDRAAALDRLRSPEGGPFSAHLLSNARCLTEGVDVPALDAVLFLSPRNSEIDIVQAIGRVMRKSPGKDIGYVVLPVLVPEGRADEAPERLEASDFAEVFKVLRALRSHDERLDALVNFASTACKTPVGIIDSRDAVTNGETGDETIEDEDGQTRTEQGRLQFELPQQIASMIVEEVGDRQYWPSWGRRAKTAYEAVLKRCADFGAAEHKARRRLEAFAKSLRQTVMPHITDAEAAKMLAMHVVTIPVFNAFFQDSKFAAHNPVSQQVNGVLNALAALGCGFDDITEPLAANYERIKKVLADAEPSERLDKLSEVYEGFFKTAIPDVVERLGVVYTPVPVVDFVLRSADAVCRREFGRGLGDEGVAVMDPFAGTGTFLTRMFDLQLPGGGAAAYRRSGRPQIQRRSRRAAGDSGPGDPAARLLHRRRPDRGMRSRPRRLRRRLRPLPRRGAGRHVRVLHRENARTAQELAEPAMGPGCRPARERQPGRRDPLTGTGEGDRGQSTVVGWPEIIRRRQPAGRLRRDRPTGAGDLRGQAGGGNRSCGGRQLVR